MGPPLTLSPSKPLHLLVAHNYLPLPQFNSSPHVSPSLDQTPPLSLIRLLPASPPCRRLSPPPPYRRLPTPQLGASTERRCFYLHGRHHCPTPLRLVTNPPPPRVLTGRWALSFYFSPWSLAPICSSAEGLLVLSLARYPCSPWQWWPSHAVIEACGGEVHRGVHGEVVRWMLVRRSTCA